MAEEHELTESGSHIATQRGYAAGRIIDAGDAVPPGIAFHESWMVKSSDYREPEEDI